MRRVKLKKKRTVTFLKTRKKIPWTYTSGRTNLKLYTAKIFKALWVHFRCKSKYNENSFSSTIHNAIMYVFYTVETEFVVR